MDTPTTFAAETAQSRWDVQEVAASIVGGALPSGTESPVPFFHMMERLKTTKREGWRRFGIDRGESIADHMYRMSLITMFAPPSLSSRLDIPRCTRMALVHDMAEALVGDITPVDGVAKDEKSRRESTIMDYFASGLLECRIHHLHLGLYHHGTLLTPNGAELHNDLCNDFDSYCFTATMLIEKGLHVEFRHALSKASALVEQILRAEHPRTLACFLEVFIHLIQTGLPDVASFLRDLIKRMSAKVTRKGHPWGQICQLLGELDLESLDQAMAQIWKCTTNTFDSELGMFNRLAVSVRLDYIKRVYGITNYLKEERLLRGLLAQFGGIPRLATPRVMLNLAHNLNRQGRHDEAEEMALKVISLP